MSYSGYALVRDKSGKPRFDDIAYIHPNYWVMLSQDEKDVIKQERKENKRGSNTLSSNP